MFFSFFYGWSNCQALRSYKKTHSDIMYERASFSPYSRRRLTRDWHIIAEDVEDYGSSKCTTRRKTFADEVWLESNIDLHNLVSNTLEFVTGSTYEGQCSKNGMEGVGTYTFPHGVVYEGQFRDGTFHGKGILIYPQGQALHCTYHKGKLTEWEYILSPPHTSATGEEDFLTSRRMSQESEESIKLKPGEETEPVDIATYCKPPDRRFLISYAEGLRAAPKENLINERPSREIPRNCYDVGDGFYNPRTRWVHRAGDMDTLLYMIPGRKKKPKLSTEKTRRQFIEDIPHVPVYKTEEWIKEHCRKAWDETVGFKPNLYEYWFSGRERQREKSNMRYVEDGGCFVREESINEECLKLLQESSTSADNVSYSRYSHVDNE